MGRAAVGAAAAATHEESHQIREIKRSETIPGISVRALRLLILFLALFSALGLSSYFFVSGLLFLLPLKSSLLGPNLSGTNLREQGSLHSPQMGS